MSQPKEPLDERAASRPALTPSQRRLTPGRLRLYRIAVPIALGIVRFWWGSCRIVRVLGEEHAAAAVQAAPVIPVYWHEQQLFCVRYLVSLRGQGVNVGFLISPSVDGELPAMLARRAGVEVLRGSSSNTGAKTLRDFYAALKAGISPSITPDGPSGPAREFKPGSLLMSQMLGRPILPVAWAAASYWRLPTWDSFIVPRPFTRIVVAVGAPVTVPRTLDGGIEAWQARLKQTLDGLYADAAAQLAAPRRR